jgi:hypothetical protein
MSGAGRVTLRVPAGTGGAVVDLFDYSNYVSVPSRMTVPQGLTTGQFQVTTSPVGTSVPATVTASYQGGTRKTTFTVSNALILKDVSMNPTSIHGGQSSVGTVRLNKAVGFGSFTVSLSDNLSVLTLPTSVQVTAGNSSAAFVGTTTAIGSTRVATISATANGITRTTTLTVMP